MKFLTIILIITYSLCACIPNRYIKGTPFKNTLLYEDQDSVSFYPGHKVAVWKPTKKEIRQAESLMQHYIYERKLLKNLPTYSRQYVGIEEEGKRIILIEGFCIDSQLFLTDWKDHLIRVDDGGDCFFSIKVDLILQKCYNFGVNSEA